MADHAHRVILVSDMHYTTDERPIPGNQTFPPIRISPAAGDAFGYTQEQKVSCVCQDILEQTGPLDAVLVLGDLSIDDYGFRNLPVNYCERFKKQCLDLLPCPSYVIAGNHDSYPNGIWKNIFGYDRQFSVKIGNAVFIMLDTFRQVPASGASGSAFTDVDIPFLERELAKYPNETIFLCAHYFREGNEELSRILKNNDRIICLFQGHTHINGVYRPDSFQGKCLVDIGGYGYNGECVNGKWVFDRFDAAWAWGYEVLEWDKSSVRMYHVKPKRVYHAGNGVFDYPGSVEGLLTLSI